MPIQIINTNDNNHHFIQKDGLVMSSIKFKDEYADHNAISAHIFSEPRSSVTNEFISIFLNNAMYYRHGEGGAIEAQKQDMVDNGLGWNLFLFEGRDCVTAISNGASLCKPNQPFSKVHIGSPPLSCPS